MTWIQQLMEATKEDESPPKYYYWAGLSAISGILANRVWLERGGLFKLYPNIFTLLLGPSGIKKGPPIALAKNLVIEVDNTRVFAGRLSIQKAISMLSTSHTRAGKEVIKDAIGYFSASEFASFIIQDPAALTILTDLYDTHYNEKGWTNYTKKSDQEELKNPCITVFGASNETHFKEAVPISAENGGFLARTFIVSANKRGKLNPLTEDEVPIDIKCLSVHLKSAALLKGPFQWTKEAKEYYNEWYTQFDSVDKSQDSTGTLNRVTDSALKVAMLISISRGLDLRLELDDVKEAVNVCEDTVLGAKRLVMGAGKNPLGPQTAMLIRYLLVQPEYKSGRKNILDKHWGHFDTFQLDSMIETLTQMGAINVKFESGETHFKLTEKVINNYEKKGK
jgi:hypothetical protein